jgi:hypothetical protein
MTASNNTVTTEPGFQINTNKTNTKEELEITGS